jgi:hypothetical protein
MTDQDDLARHLISGLPAPERAHCIEAVGLGRGYPLAVAEVELREQALFRQSSGSGDSTPL